MSFSALISLIAGYDWPPQRDVGLKRTQRDAVIKRSAVEAQTMENHVENMMEI